MRVGFRVGRGWGCIFEGGGHVAKKTFRLKPKPSMLTSKHLNEKDDFRHSVAGNYHIYYGYRAQSILKAQGYDRQEHHILEAYQHLKSITLSLRPFRTFDMHDHQIQTCPKQKSLDPDPKPLRHTHGQTRWCPSLCVSVVPLWSWSLRGRSCRGNRYGLGLTI